MTLRELEPWVLIQNIGSDHDLLPLALLRCPVCQGTVEAAHRDGEIVRLDRGIHEGDGHGGDEIRAEFHRRGVGR